jgi:HemY protein
MRFGVAAMLAVLLGAFVAHFLLADRGYVLINFRGYVVEMSVPGLVILLVLAYLFVRALVAVADAPRRWRAARSQRRLERRDSDLTAGLTQLIEGNWARSERLLTQGLKHADAPLANYLLAAHAAQQQGAVDRRDQWLALAQGISAEGATSALLTRAELQLAAGDAAAAVATLQTLERDKPDQPAAAALLARAYRMLGDRSQLMALLPRLARAPLPAAEREEVAKLAVQGELARPDLTSERLDEIWAAVPNELKSAPAVLAERARALDRLGRGDEAERELKAALKRDWNGELVQRYGEVRGADSAKQLKQAEAWLKNYPDDAALLLAAARLSMANELWGKARSYLESSLSVAPTADAYALYGRLLTQLGEDHEALDAFRSGLKLVSAEAAVEPTPLLRSLAPPGRDAERTDAARADAELKARG